MFILPIFQINTNKNLKKTSFQSKMSCVAKDLPATLDTSTMKQVYSLMSGYSDILVKLKSKTSEGLKFIQENFPNITIGKNLIFHNCGEEKSSISLQISENEQHKKMIEFAEYQNSEELQKVFLIGEDKHILKNSQEEKYYTEIEAEELKLNERLKNLLSKLDEAMLSFRLFLNKNSGLDSKPSFGKINLASISILKQINNNIERINELSSKLPIKVAKEVKRSYSNYKPTTGSPTQVFQNLGKEAYTISYHAIDSDINSGLNRLSVFDSSKNLVRTFVVSNEGKMVKNLNQNFENFLPQNIIYFDSTEIEKEENGKFFDKALKLYNNELQNFREYLERFVEDRIRRLQNIPYLLPITNQKNIENILITLERIQFKLKKVDANTVANIKKDFQDLFAPAGRKGITFDGFEDNKRVYLLPIKSNLHDGLVRLTITSIDGEEKVYLIKDSKCLVKNFNPEFPQILPKVLFYKTEFDLNDDISEPLEFLNKKILEYETFVDSKIAYFESQKIANKENMRIKKENKAKELQEKAEQKNKIKIEKEKQKNIELSEKKAEKLRENEKRKKELLKQKEIHKFELAERKRIEKLKLNEEKQRRLELLSYYKAKASELSRSANKNSENFNNLLLEIQTKINEFLNK